MEIQLIKGRFSTQDSLDLITKMAQVKIAFHESKISPDSTEEDIKMREARIISIKNELSEARSILNNKDGNINIQCKINIQ